MVVIVFTVGAAVKPAANSLPEDTKEPEQIPVEQFSKYRVEDLQHILYIRIELKSEFEQ